MIIIALFAGLWITGATLVAGLCVAAARGDAQLDV